MLVIERTNQIKEDIAELRLKTIETKNIELKRFKNIDDEIYDICGFLETIIKNQTPKKTKMDIMEEKEREYESFYDYLNR